jgi:hypothetical protein
MGHVERKTRVANRFSGPYHVQPSGGTIATHVGDIVTGMDIDKNYAITLLETAGFSEEVPSRCYLALPPVCLD